MGVKPIDSEKILSSTVCQNKIIKILFFSYRRLIFLLLYNKSYNLIYTYMIGAKYEWVHTKHWLK